MYIEKFLTEYDDSLTGELNVDPLGQLVIWSSWGQDIFHSRITSIANDVRQYTLNRKRPASTVWSSSDEFDKVVSTK